ncbi:MAG: SGNH/GDSL hydrolase family protein [Deltaproteobacteria bacterium]|nr:SGNH/GDSL hydrolase family protein [Deltaproteobacteria bacterium]
MEGLGKDGKERLFRSALLVGSVVVALAVSETYLRVTRPLETFFNDLQFKPEIASEGWERAFVRDYGVLRRQGALGGDLHGFLHDPELGWDTPGRLRNARTYSVAKPPGVFRVLAIGDSYTYGSEVETNQTYSSYLEQELASNEVLNMGVKAYGIDQAAAKYLKYGRSYRPDVLIFGVFGPDYVRVPLTFFRFAKPVFRLDAAGELVLAKVPIPPPEEVYRGLRKKLWPLSYTFALLRSAFYGILDPHPHEAYYRRWDPLVEKIFTAVLNAAERDGSQVIFLYIPTGAHLATDEGLNNYCCDRGHLAAIWKRLAEKYPSFGTIDLMEVLPREYSRKVVYEQMIMYHNGRPTGHFTPFGNQAVAKVIAQYLNRKIGAALSSHVALDR